MSTERRGDDGTTPMAHAGGGGPKAPVGAVLRVLDAPTQPAEQHVVPNALRPVHGQWLHLGPSLTSTPPPRVVRPPTCVG